MSELAACGLLTQGATSIGVINRTLGNAAELAAKLGGSVIPFEERWQPMAEADIIISSTSCPHAILSRKEVENIICARKNRGLTSQPLVIVDLAMPRDVDPTVRNIKGVFLCDLDDLENVTDQRANEREVAAVEAQKILQAEAQGFRRKLMSERGLSTIVGAALPAGRALPARTGCFPR